MQIRRNITKFKEEKYCSACSDLSPSEPHIFFRRLSLIAKSSVIIKSDVANFLPLSDTEICLQFLRIYGTYQFKGFFVFFRKTLKHFHFLQKLCRF